MSFRRNKKDKEWKEWCKLHQNILNTFGIPEKIFETEERWFIFLEHGYDEVDWSNKSQNIFTVNLLKKKELISLSNFLLEEYGTEYNSLIKELNFLTNSIS